MRLSGDGPLTGENATLVTAAHKAPVRTAIVPLAGLGTRLLPATKAMPKGMIPVVDKPVVQYIVEEAIVAGMSDVLLITGSGQQSIADHFARAHDLEARLEACGDSLACAQVREVAELANISIVRQDEPAGLGHAVLCAAEHVGHEPFAVLFGDNLVHAREGLLARLIAVRQQHGGSVITLLEVPHDIRPSFGVVAFEPTSEPEVVMVTDVVAGPAKSEARSNWIMIGRCVFDPALFEVLRRTPPGLDGEIQLSDAVRMLASAGCRAGGAVRGLLFHGRRFDTGDKQDLLRTTVEFACARPDLAGEFVPWLRGFVTAMG